MPRHAPIPSVLAVVLGAVSMASGCLTAEMPCEDDFETLTAKLVPADTEADAYLAWIEWSDSDAGTLEKACDDDPETLIGVGQVSDSVDQAVENLLGATLPSCSLDVVSDGVPRYWLGFVLPLNPAESELVNERPRLTVAGAQNEEIVRVAGLDLMTQTSTAIQLTGSSCERMFDARRAITWVM